ncbi:MAG TPA: hypothetical protein VGF61_22565 [Candidatus Acidoferrum sp.]
MKNNEAAAKQPSSSTPRNYPPVPAETGPALHVTGFTLYQQTVGQPLRIGIHLRNDGKSTINTYGTSCVGVFSSDDDRGSIELQETVFRNAEQTYDKLEQSGELIALEIPPGAQIHFDIDTKPKVLTKEMLDSIATGSINAYFAGIIKYQDLTGEEVIPYCGFTDGGSRSIPNCRIHNAPFHARAKK